MKRRWLTVVAAAAVSTSCNAVAQTGTGITNVSLVDGTGSPARPAAVRIIGDRIAEIGELTPRNGDRGIDGGGLVNARRHGGGHHAASIQRRR